MMRDNDMNHRLARENVRRALLALACAYLMGCAAGGDTGGSTPDARRFAPTWDEPGLKATFRLSAAAPAGQTAFSNMPVAGQTELPGGNKLWHFAMTLKMSS